MFYSINVELEEYLKCIEELKDTDIQFHITGIHRK